MRANVREWVGSTSWESCEAILPRESQTNVLETLEHRARLVTDRISRTDLVLFAKSGFTPGCERAAAKAGNVMLLTPADMF